MVYSYEDDLFTIHRNGYDIKQRFHELTGEFVNLVKYSSLILAMTGGAGVYASCVIQGIPCTPALIVIMVLVSFSVYNLNRKTDEKEDEINHKERFGFTKRFEKPLLYAAIISYIVALLICAAVGPPAILVGLIPLASGILYSVPLLPRTWKYHRLKEVPLLKNIIVAGAWACTLALLPALMYGISSAPVMFVAGLFFFTYVVMASVLPDIRDIEGDARVGVHTIPVLLGERRTRVVLVGITLAAVCLVFIPGIRLLSLPVLALLLAGFVYVLLCIGSMDTFLDKNFVCDILADGGFIVFGILAYLMNPLLLLSG